MNESSRPTFAIVITAKDEKAALPQNVKYHRFIGAERILIYDDGSTDGTAETVGDLPGVCFQPSVPFEKYAHLHHFTEGINYPKSDYQFRMMLNAYDALLKCREQSIDWLIMLDADELVSPHEAYVYPEQLNDLLATIPYNVQEVRFPTLEVVQRQFQYKDVFQDETLFKRRLDRTDFGIEASGYKGIIRRLFSYERKARRLLPMSKDARHQLVDNPTPIRRQLFHPIENRYVVSNGFYGHLYGKTAVRTNLDVWPVDTHFFKSVNGERLKAVCRGNLLHYQFHSFTEFVSKPAKHPLPELLASVPYLNPVKRMFFEIMHDKSLSERELEDYYQRWVMFSDAEIKKLRAPRSWGFVPRDDALVQVDTVRRVLASEAAKEMELKARISVVVPAYNAARYIGQTIDSIIAQTYDNWELIIVNDGSTDNTAAIAQRYADEDVRITLINQDNQGEIAARRRGFRESSGEYIYFLDSDDTAWPDALQRFHNVLTGFPEIVAAFGCHRTIGKGGWIRGQSGAVIPPEHPTNILPKLLILNFIQPGAICIRRKQMALADFTSKISFGGDWVMWCRLAAKGPFVHLGDRPLCDYRTHDQNISDISRSPLEKREKPVEIIFSDSRIMGSISPRQQRILRQKSLFTIYFYAGLRSLEAMQLSTVLTCIRRASLCVLKAPSNTTYALENLMQVRRRIFKGLVPPIVGCIDGALNRFPRTHATARKIGQGLRKSTRLPRLLRYGDIDPANYLVFEDRQLAYLVNSKVACTSIRLTIGKAYGLHVTKPLLIHDDSLWTIQKGRLRGKASDFHSFTFVRDPFERLVSCYRDRVLYNGPKEFALQPFFSDYLYTIPPNISFEEFVRIIARIPDRLADRHFKSQTHSLYARGRRQVDFIGRFENLGSDWKIIADRFGFDVTLPVANRSGLTSPGADYRNYYTPELVEMVYQRYKRDVELLGYADAYRSLQAAVRSDSVKTSALVGAS